MKQIDLSRVTLLPSLFSERADMNRAYLMELDSQCLLQNYYLEAGIVMPGLQVVDDPNTANLHWGWEAPTCQLRGHFLGHWMSAAALRIRTHGDRPLQAKLADILDELDRCRILNGGRWIGPFPEKYFGKLERDEYIWSPQYTMHKTLMGLYHAWLWAGMDKALDLLSHAADWYLDWTARMQEVNPHAVYSGEEGGMLEIWAGLYIDTKDERYLTLAKRYSEPSIFRKLEEGLDPLSNCHANASIPWAHGAARMYEATGDEKWLKTVKLFWDCAVKARDAYCTGGQNAGEFWVPPRQNGRFLTERNQEFCTMYNMVRLADYLYRFTGDTAYADYIERCLYNGFLAQQNKMTGMPTYFLPMKAGSRKKWGSKRHDFWCCHGTMVQAQTIYPTLAFYEEGKRLVVGQYIPAAYTWMKDGQSITVEQSVDMKYYNAQAFFDENDQSQMSRWQMKLTVRAEGVPAAIALRVPGWAKGVTVLLNGEVTDAPVRDGYITFDRTWNEDSISVYFRSELTLAPLPDMPEVAGILDGPIVLAGLCDRDCGIDLNGGTLEEVIVPNTEHTYGTFPWMQTCCRTRNQAANFDLMPLYDVTEETYTMYFTIRK